MKYLSKEPFSSKPSSKEYRDGWARTFGVDRGQRSRAVETVWERDPDGKLRCVASREVKPGKPRYRGNKLTSITVDEVSHIPDRSFEQLAKGVGPLPTTGLAGKRRKP